MRKHRPNDCDGERSDIKKTAGTRATARRAASDAAPPSRAIRAVLDRDSLGAPENVIGLVVWRVTHRFQREIEQALRHLDLTHLQFTVLALVAYMSRHDEPVAAADVARLGDIHPMQVSVVIRALERKRFVRRRARGRVLNLTLTTEGLRVLRAAFPLTKAVQVRLFGADGAPGGVLLEKLLQIERNEV